MNNKSKKYAFMICGIILLLESVLFYNSPKSIAFGHIPISITENGKEVVKNYTEGEDSDDIENGDLLGELFELEPEMIQFGKKYKEEMCVQNTGDIDVYVRTIITKKWIDADGNGNTKLNPEYINLELKDQENWILAVDQSTTERYVMYYEKIIPSGERSTNFIDNIIIDPEVIKKYEIKEETTDEGKVITMKSLYDNNSVDLNIEVDAVQTHNAKEAIKSAWGVNVTIDADGNIEGFE